VDFASMALQVAPVSYYVIYCWVFYSLLCAH